MLPLQQTSVSQLKGVGSAMQQKLQRLGLNSLGDLLFHLPLRYQDRSRLVPIGSLRPSDEALIEGVIQSCELQQGKRRMLNCRIQDGSGTLRLRFFHFAAAQQRQLSQGRTLRCFGEVRPGPQGLEMVHPEYRFIESDQPVPVAESLTPIYPATEGLQQPRLRGLILQALEQLSEDTSMPELLPPVLLRHYQQLSLAESLRLLHQPPVDANLAQLAAGLHPAQQRLALEELLAHHLSLRKLRAQVQQQSAPALTATQQLITPFLAQLPFPLTSAQQRVGQEIAEDLKKPWPMLRLVQGDVGSGKTMVAALAALTAVEAGWQAVIMAPTEILAEQHYRNFTLWCEPLGLQVAWLAGKLKGKKREQQTQLIASGEAAIVVGTHALFQEGVEFAKLALVVIDEQHRFGVHQRLSLREKGRYGDYLPHQLIMTATPIPRTLAMSAYADLDCSVIDELPPGRTPVETVVISDSRRDQVIERVASACAEGRQAYWVCTLIDESEVLQCQAAEVTATSLAELLPQLRIGLVHGRMKATDKQTVMDAFKAAELDLLVATTVIEVGVDVPNASVMIIENPERLGLAQLHQLRGRVGRGSVASFCVLMYQLPLSKQGKERLAVMRETSDGFIIAERDLQLRGPGEVLGTRQTGEMNLKVADLQRDGKLLDLIQRYEAQLQLNEQQSHDLISRWLGEGEQYGYV